MRIGLGADHKGLPLKESIKAHLIELGYEVVDYGVTIQLAYFKPAHGLTRLKR